MMSHLAKVASVKRAILSSKLLRVIFTTPSFVCIGMWLCIPSLFVGFLVTLAHLSIVLRVHFFLIRTPVPRRITQLFKNCSWNICSQHVCLVFSSSNFVYFQHVLFRHVVVTALSVLQDVSLVCQVQVIVDLAGAPRALRFTNESSNQIISVNTCLPYFRDCLCFSFC